MIEGTVKYIWAKSLSLAAPFAILCGACTVQAPQSGDEFKAQVDGSLFAKVESVEAAAPFDRAMRNLRPLVFQCFDQVRPGGRPYILTSREHGSIVDKGPGHAQILIQDDGPHGINVVTPPGGNIVLVADVVAKGQATSITVHSGVTKIGYARALQAWATGASKSCFANIGL